VSDLLGVAEQDVLAVLQDEAMSDPLTAFAHVDHPEWLDEAGQAGERD
jgi:hypothetical protein